MTRLNALERRALRVLRMVGELHGMGYQKIRIVPGMASSGMYWRCAVTSKRRIAADHGALTQHDELFEPPHVAAYTTGSDNEYFGWTDAQRATAGKLATLFVDRFPLICDEGRGQDWAYAGWYVHMLGLAKTGALPVAYRDRHGPAPVGWMETIRPDTFAHMPPGGDGRRIGAPDLWGPWPVPRHPIRVEIRSGYTMVNLVARTVEQVRAAGLDNDQISQFIAETRPAHDREGLQRVATRWFDVQVQTK